MRILTLVLSALVLALVGLGYGQYHKNSVLSTENQRLTEASKRAVERELEYRRILGTRQKEIASQRLKLQAAETALQNALKANKTWSDTDVPTDVQNALSGAPDGPGGVRNTD
ncbi:hypothetical protein HOU10_gp43 [Curvibacter phage P26059B]|uniref:Uncharacterized protein n=1 Tax=Curvibacter phage P26059B TaxID=1983784 RepID=A0A384UH69_9CAUD|nr:hypothetical protein HOU10_gp43 [Curvibacter phage P26059B]ASJ79319.1 hypothetical protein P26059B_0043 [Curvibacter phage P26059B]